MAAVAFFGAPLIAALLEMFVKDLRIEDLVSWLRRNTKRVRLGYIHHIYVIQDLTFRYEEFIDWKDRWGIN